MEPEYHAEVIEHPNHHLRIWLDSQGWHSHILHVFKSDKKRSCNHCYNDNDLKKRSIFNLFFFFKPLTYGDFFMVHELTPKELQNIWHLRLSSDAVWKPGVLPPNLVFRKHIEVSPRGPFKAIGTLDLYVFPTDRVSQMKYPRSWK